MASEAPIFDWHDLKRILPEDLVQGLSSNGPPSQAAIQYIEAARANPTELQRVATRRIVKLEEEIQKMQAEKDILIDGPRVRATWEQVFNTIASPIRRLPHDIIREIVLHAVDDSYPSPERTAVALCLGRVCSAWRAIILSSPRLWSTLYLVVTDFTHAGIMRYKKAVGTWFQRAGALPLQFFLYFNCGDLAPRPTAEGYIVKMFLRSLAPWTARITRLGVGSSDWMGVMPYFADVEWPLPNLQRFDILGQRTRDWDLGEGVLPSLISAMDRITLFRDSRALHTIVAWQEISAYSARLAFFPWQQITKLSLDEELCDESRLRSLFQSCPQLRNARLRVDTRWSRPDLVFVHNNLETLELSLNAQDHDDLVAVFSPYRFPRLAALWVRIQVEDDEYEVESIDSPRTDDPFPSLRVLVIRGFTLQNPAVTDFLQMTPHLHTLHVDIFGSLDIQPTCDVNELCRFLTVRPNQPSPVALMEEFSFHYENPQSRLRMFILDPDVVSGFVQSRTDNGGHLWKAVFSGGLRLLSDVDPVFSVTNVLEISADLDVSVKRLPPPLPVEVGKPFFQPGLMIWPQANTASHHC